MSCHGFGLFKWLLFWLEGSRGQGRSDDTYDSCSAFQVTTANGSLMRGAASKDVNFNFTAAAKGQTCSLAPLIYSSALRNSVTSSTVQIKEAEHPVFFFKKNQPVLLSQF